MKVWVAAYDGPHGNSVLGAWDSEEAMYAGVARLIRQFDWWSEAVESNVNQNRDSDEEKLSKEPPADDRQCVQEYFEVMGEDPYNPKFMVDELVEVRTLLNEKEIVK